MDFSSEWNNNEEAASNDFAPIPEGDYVAAIDNCTIDLTKSPNRLSIVYKIVGPTSANRKLFGNYNLAGQGVGFLKKDLKLLGLDYSAVKKPEELVELVWTAVNQKVDVHVTHREYNGKIYENVFVNGMTGKPRPSTKSTKTPAQKAAKAPSEDTDFSFA